MTHPRTSPPLFREVQRFRQPWLWLLVLGVAALIWWGALTQLLLGEPWGNRPAPDGAVAVLWLVFGVGLPLFFWSLRLVTEVRADGVYIRFIPFHWSFQHMPLTEVKQFEAKTYRPVLEYGGWGIRYGFGGKAYNVIGNRGVQLELTNGKRLLIGSQRPEEMVSAIQKAGEGIFEPLEA
jgi:hypothetical protein